MCVCFASPTCLRWFIVLISQLSTPFCSLPFFFYKLFTLEAEKNSLLSVYLSATCEVLPLQFELMFAVFVCVTSSFSVCFVQVSLDGHDVVWTVAQNETESESLQTPLFGLVGKRLGWRGWGCFQNVSLHLNLMPDI